jgi:hypothetical protein
MDHIWMQLSFLLLLATHPTAQQPPPTKSTNSEIAEPKLPVVKGQPCLSNGRVGWPIKSGSPVYSSWRNTLKPIGRLTAGQRLSVLSGINITRQPDRIVVTKPKPDIGLIPGDVILRYQVFGEGQADIWTKGIWHEGYDLWTVVETDGAGCNARNNTCDSRVTENGIMERWVQVKTDSGLTGWVLQNRVTRGVYWDSQVFGQLCAG